MVNKGFGEGEVSTWYFMNLRNYMIRTLAATGKVNVSSCHRSIKWNSCELINLDQSL